MSVISLDAYVVKVREANTRKATPLPLGSFDGTNSVIDFCHSTLDKLTKKYVSIDALKKSIKVANLFLSNKKDICRGVFSVGEYGVAGDIIDTATGAVNYKKKTTDADPKPYFFEFRIPKVGSHGILIVQRTGLGGIKGLMDLLVVHTFKTAFTEYVLDINPLIPSQVLQEYLKVGQIQEVTFIKHQIPADIAEKFSGISNLTPGSIEVKVKPKGFTDFFKKDGLIEFQEGKRSVDKVYGFNDVPYDSIKVSVDVGGRTQQFDVVKPSRIRASLDISKTVVTNPDGHPDFNSLVLHTEKYVKGLAQKAGIVL